MGFGKGFDLQIGGSTQCLLSHEPTTYAALTTRKVCQATPLARFSKCVKNCV